MKKSEETLINKKEGMKLLSALIVKTNLDLSSLYEKVYSNFNSCYAYRTKKSLQQLFMVLIALEEPTVKKARGTRHERKENQKRL